MNVFSMSPFESAIIQILSPATSSVTSASENHNPSARLVEQGSILLSYMQCNYNDSGLEHLSEQAVLPANCCTALKEAGLEQ